MNPITRELYSLYLITPQTKYPYREMHVAFCGSYPLSPILLPLTVRGTLLPLTVSLWLIAFRLSLALTALVIGPGFGSILFRELTRCLLGFVTPLRIGRRYVWYILQEPRRQNLALTLSILGTLQATSAACVQLCNIGPLLCQQLYTVCQPRATGTHQWCGAALANVCYI